MYAYNSNAAYDFSQFEVDENAARKPKPKPKTENHIKLHKTSAAKSGNWFKTVAVVAFAALIAFVFVNGKAVISELSIDISEGTTALEEAKNENARLQSELDGMVSLSKVDEVATTALGLQKTAKSQVRYISVYDRTMVQAAGNDENIFVSFKKWLDNTAEYLGF